MGTVDIEAVEIEKEEEDQVIVGMANFTIKTCDDLFRSVLAAVPGVKVAAAMNEAAPRIVRVTGNDPRLEELASRNALKIAASHAFVIMMREAFPINVMDKVKGVPGVCTILGATANPCHPWQDRPGQCHYGIRGWGPGGFHRGWGRRGAEEEPCRTDRIPDRLEG
jgi:adenosine/AMP kinase